MKKLLRATVAAVALIAAIVFAGCDTFPPKRIFSKTGVKLPDYEFVTEVDTRRGPHGDGELIYSFQFNEKNGKTLETRIQSAEHWQALPMTATLNELVYEHFDGKIPHVENGYYFFYDKQSKNYTVPDDFIEQSYSYDFVIGMYDTESLTVYYYEQHT